MCASNAENGRIQVREQLKERVTQYMDICKTPTSNQNSSVSHHRETNEPIALDTARETAQQYKRAVQFGDTAPSVAAEEGGRNTPSPFSGEG